MRKAKPEDPGSVVNTHVDKIIGAIRKEFRGASIRRMAEGSRSAMQEVIPTGLDVLDNWVFGVGGIPGNRVGEIYGGPGAGKTGIGLLCLGAAQRAGGLAILYETEGTLEIKRALDFGCNINDVILGEPDCADDVVTQINKMLDLVPAGVGPNVIVWDSLASAPSEKSTIGSKARLMSEELPRITKKLAAKRTAILIINQIRMKINVFFGSPETTPGGEALKYMTSWRMQLWRGASIKSGVDTVGHYVTIGTTRNKVAMPNRKVRLKLDYTGEGWVNSWATIDFAKERGLIPKETKSGDKAYETAKEALTQLDGWHCEKKKN